jgi:CubicO group peptidase (beta-lactamase class C family)
MFAIGSVTKQFTCSALMILADEKKLSLNDPVSKYYPMLTRAKDITLLDLGGHLSGYRDYYPLDFTDNEKQKPMAPDAIISKYATLPLDFEPRSRWSYSNTGFLILGRTIEKVSGQSLGTFMAQRLFAPLSLTRTAFEPTWSATKDMATGYTSFGLAPLTPAAPEAAGWLGGAGAIWSTPTDLLTWDRALLEQTLMSPGAYATMTTTQRLTDGRVSGYGCGEQINDGNPAWMIYHSGGVAGFIAQNTILPSTKSAVVILTNADALVGGAMNTLYRELVLRLIPSTDTPTIQGRSAIDVARGILAGFEQGTVDRSLLSTDFSDYLTPAKLAATKQALGALGPVKNVRISGAPSERGGMEVVSVLFEAGVTRVRASMFRTPDGKVQEFSLAPAG